MYLNCIGKYGRLQCCLLVFSMILEAKLLSKFVIRHSMLLSPLTFYGAYLSTAEVVRDCQLGLCSH